MVTNRNFITYGCRLDSLSCLKVIKESQATGHMPHVMTILPYKAITYAITQKYFHFVQTNHFYFYIPNLVFWKVFLDSKCNLFWKQVLQKLFSNPENIFQNACFRMFFFFIFWNGNFQRYFWIQKYFLNSKVHSRIRENIFVIDILKVISKSKKHRTPISDFFLYSENTF